MRWRTLPVELLLLGFLGLFLVYPLVYVLPGAAGEVVFTVTSVAADGAVTQTSFPVTDQAGAEAAKKKAEAAGATATLARETRWTDFYFRQTLGVGVEATSSFPFVRVVPASPFLWECLTNSLLLAALTTLATTAVCLPLAGWFSRYHFPGKGVLSALLLVPLIVPPFVGAIGLERLLNRFGTLNLLLMQAGFLDPDRPIDWLAGGGFGGIVLMQILHLYPILYLNLTAAWSNLDPTLEDAARNLGAGEATVFRTVTFPLLLPGYFAGASLVFVWAFTDLGTPLVFNFDSVIAVQIYDQVSDPQRTNSVAYALVVVTLVITAGLFYLARWLVNRVGFVAGGKGAVGVSLKPAGAGRTALIYVVVLGLTALALLPDVGVVLTAVARRWQFTAFPSEYTGRHLADVWSTRLSALSIKNSLIYSAVSTLLDLILGVALAWLIARRPTRLTAVLDGLAMLPLALPGLVLAFGYLTCYNAWKFPAALAWLNPAANPALLLVIAYTVRRLPYLTRSAFAGLQQISPALEEAAENLGASRWRVVRTVTLPLIAANILAGVILTFAFAVLEVSDSLMLAREERYYPITRAIVGLLLRPDDGDRLASALALFAMALLGGGLLVASLALGRKFGELFRA